MAHSKDQLSRTSTPCAHIRSEKAYLSFQPKHNGQPVQSHGSYSEKPFASVRNDTGVLVHSTAHSPLSPAKKEVSMEDTKNPIRYEETKGFDLPDAMFGSALTESSETTGTTRQQSKGAEKLKTYNMPLHEKVSQDESPSISIDIPRSSLDNDGLGIYTKYSREGRLNDPLANHVSRKNVRAAHRRSTSGTSQFSTGSGSSMGKLGSQYIHPMRQAPRVYTPPLGQSYQASDLESEDSGKADTIEGESLAKSSLDMFHSSLRASSGQAPRLSLQIQESSFTRLPGTSQTNITGRSSFGYSRDNGSTLDTASPISRPSLDFVFKSKTRSSMDPVSRAATIQAARQAFEEKEAAKTRKIEEQQMKLEQRNNRRKEKQHWRASLKDGEAIESRDESTWEKNFQSKQCGHETQSTPASSTSTPPEPKSGVWKSQSRNTWMHFLTWLRTRVFKLRRRVKKLS